MRMLISNSKCSCLLLARLVPTFRILLLAGLTSYIGLANAVEEGSSHLHLALPVDSELTLRSVLDATVDQYPESIELSARDSEAAAWVSRSRSWLSAPPALSGRYQSDRWGDNNRLKEIEVGIELPIWRWGERTATRSLGDAMGTEATSAATALRWQVAGILRAALWDIALADNDFALAEEAHQIASRLATVVERRHELGDVALSDALLAQTAALEAQTQLIDARASKLDAERAYRSLTTLEQRPPFENEIQSTRHDIESTHPALVFANAEVRRAQARQDTVYHSAKGAPSLLIGPRRERAAFAQSTDDSIGVAVRIPFGGSVHRKTEVTAAGRETASVLAARNRLIRLLDLQLHEAAHELAVVRENLVTASERSALADRQLTMAQSAYEKGELEIINLLKIQNEALAAKRQMTSLIIGEKRQTSLYNQAVGELP